MANGRNPRATSRKAKLHGRLEDGQFISLPWAVIDSPAFARLSFSSRSLLLEIARQFSVKKFNNGYLKASHLWLKNRGFGGRSTVSQGLVELERMGFVYRTRQGRYPNVSSLYALTWYQLPPSEEFDVGSFDGFERCAYRKVAEKLPPIKKRRCTKFDKQGLPQEQILNTPSSINGLNCIETILNDARILNTF